MAFQLTAGATAASGTILREAVRRLRDDKEVVLAGVGQALPGWFGGAGCAVGSGSLIAVDLLRPILLLLGLLVGAGVAVGFPSGAGVGSGFVVVGFRVTFGSSSVFSVPATMMKLTCTAEVVLALAAISTVRVLFSSALQAGEGQGIALYRPVQLVL